MWFVNDWHDVFRIAAFVMAGVCLIFLGIRFAKRSDRWNQKTKDYWFVLVLWSITGMALAVEGVYEDRPLEPRLVFYFVAILVTLKGLLNRSPWGEDV